MKILQRVLVMGFISCLSTALCVEVEPQDIAITAKPDSMSRPAQDQIEPEVAPLSSDATQIDFNAKRKATVDLVERGIAYMQGNNTDQAFNMFSGSPEFIVGELYLFVYDEHGVCLAHGQQKDFVWKNLWHLQDNYGVHVVQNIITKAKDGGGWITYTWRNATKVSYVKRVEVNGKMYVVGSGYYPHSKEDSVISLVKGAVALFNQTTAKDLPIEQAFALISYPQGQFVLGDLYLYALDFEGTIVAQGDRPKLIGTSAWEFADARGVKVNQQIIKTLKDTHKGVWIDYISKKALKHAYAEKVTDKNGKDYFIACGYYPDADRKRAVDLVRLGFQFLKGHGLITTAKIINDQADNQFRYGDLYLEVYTADGVCVANGTNTDVVGRNFMNDKDQDGKFFVREMIRRALDEPGWVDYKLRNLFKSVYVEKISIGTENYIIACGLYPISKRESTILLVKTAADYLAVHSREDAFHEFSKKNGKFIRGDLVIFVFDATGLCFVYGDNYDLIWKNLMHVKDEDGKAYVRLFINTVKNGPGQVSFRQHHARKIAYLESVVKDERMYVVGASYYI